ncbi:MAG: hypothetical protein ACXABY_36695 [Candidatus Thorarchaeota archaeon]
MPSPALVKKYGIKPNSPIWVYIDKNGNTTANGSHATETREGGWPVSVEIDSKDLDNKCEWVNHFFWVDEVVGHAVQLESIDRVYRTFEDCRRNADVISKHKAKRPHKKLAAERQRYTDFVRGTQHRAGSKPSCPLVTTKKKIYMKTKR